MFKVQGLGFTNQQLCWCRVSVKTNQRFWGGGVLRVGVQSTRPPKGIQTAKASNHETARVFWASRFGDCLKTLETFRYQQVHVK